MVIIGLDPGPEKSGVVYWVNGNIMSISGIFDNLYIEKMLEVSGTGTLAIEWITGYGMVVGQDVFETCRAVGRFEKSFSSKTLLIPRRDIKKHLCGNTTSNDSHIRQALIDRYGPVGTKKQPGPLFGLSGHMWSALAVCIVAADRMEKNG